MQRYTFFLILPNLYAVFSISGSEKEFSKSSSLVTRSVVSCCDVDVYSANSPYATRHHTHHPNRCILLRMWILYVQFTLSPLVTLKKVTSELSSQLLLYQNDMLCEGDEWVTSESKWITAVILWCTLCYSATGDESQSSVKILFFYLWKISNTTQKLLCLRWSFALPPYQSRCKSVPQL